MMNLALLRKLARDQQGALAVETAFILPILCVMALGGFETSMIISRQYEMQSAAGESEIIALAAATGATTDASKIKAILKESVSLENSQIKVEQFFRCDANESTVESADSCEEGAVVTEYIKLTLEDSYDPLWTDFGVGEKIDMKVERTVLLP